MSNLPSAVIFINLLPQDTIDTLVTQLYINEVISIDELDSRIIADPNYIQLVHSLKLRILVLNTEFSRNLENCDVVLYFRHGLVTISKPLDRTPIAQLKINDLNLYDVLREVGSDQVTILPGSISSVSSTNNCSCTGLGGIFAIKSHNLSCVYSNKNNELNNINFINRK